MKTVITKGTIITHDKTYQADIAIENGLIIEISDNIDCTNAHIIDATGNFILPGGVDMHTKLALDSEGKFSANAFMQNSLAALYGGTTTVIEEVESQSASKGKKAIESLNFYAENLRNNSYCDYSFHQKHYADEINVEDISHYITNGFPSYALSMFGKEALSDDEILDFLKITSPYGGTVFVECESKAPIRLMEDLHTIKKRTLPYAIATSRPAYAELEALIRMCNLARAGGFTLALESLSTKESVELLFRQVNEGLPVTMLTCPHYLILTDDKYLSNKNFDEESFKYCVHPPLRKADDIEALWKGIKNGLIHCIVSKHNGTSLAHKLTFADDIFNVPVGIPSVELRLPLIYTYGVETGKITINKLVEILSTHVTRIAGLRSKGRIEAGTDADILILDPNYSKTITKETLHDNSDYSPYENMQLKGFPKHVFLRGNQVVKDYKHISQESLGELTFRKAVAMR